MKLVVLQNGTVVGQLESTADRGIVFRYVPGYESLPGSLPISQSLPFRAREYSQAAAMPYFSGLLPDGDLRRRIAESLHVSEHSSLKLLEALGGECAGTISLLPDGDGSEPVLVPESGGYEELPLPELERILGESEQVPLLTPRGNARLSLAGAQDKLPLMRRNGRWYRPLGEAPTSHILKPASPVFPDIVHNEFATLRLAALLGLPVPTIELTLLGRPVLVEERYDRDHDAQGELHRVHQEDFCQALGIMPERKYQNDGGPGFADLAGLIRKACSSPLADLESLVDRGLFNTLAGNCDAHGKNFSLLYRAGTVALAPCYDLVSTLYWPALDRKLSMRLGRTYQVDRIRKDDLSGFAKDLGVSPKLVHQRLDRLLDTAGLAWEQVASLPELAGHESLIRSLQANWNSLARQLTVAS